MACVSGTRFPCCSHSEHRARLRSVSVNCSMRSQRGQTCQRGNLRNGAVRLLLGTFAPRTGSRKSGGKRKWWTSSRRCNLYSSTMNSPSSSALASPLSRSYQWSRPHEISDVPPLTTSIAPTPKGVMSCERLIGPCPLYISNFPVVQVEPRNFYLRFCINISHGLLRRPRYERALTTPPRARRSQKRRVTTYCRCATIPPRPFPTLPLPGATVKNALEVLLLFWVNSADTRQYDFTKSLN